MQDVASYQNVLNEYFASVLAVGFAYLFELPARKQATPALDIDIAVMVDQDVEVAGNFDLRLKMLGGLMQRLNRNDIDLIILNEVPLALSHPVFRDGKLGSVFKSQPQENSG